MKIDLSIEEMWLVMEELENSGMKLAEKVAKHHKTTSASEIVKGLSRSPYIPLYSTINKLGAICTTLQKLRDALSKEYVDAT